ncbi:branched-chain-amino-acid transaminase [Clostridium thermarum]|uniref:branched-chain-amino-acid transaminase n=1 Tax=Clostridium thermarum TaxID=1716543 RepID=UPI001A9AA402|nr:branched-chain-amino-acid transaminase [Clostridium thermarum]
MEVVSLRGLGRIKFTKEEIKQAVIDTIKENQFQEAYIRPVVFRGYNVLGVDPTKCPVNVVIAAWEWSPLLGDSAVINGINAKISSWSGLAPNTMPALSKAGGNYLSSQLIRMEALANGYDEGLALNSQGLLSEGSGENIFLIKDKVIYTPSIASSALSGITRDTVIKICKLKGYEIVENSIPRELLYIADEVFIVGTAAEITPLKTIDKISIGDGNFRITREIQSMYTKRLSGKRNILWDTISVPRKFGCRKTAVDKSQPDEKREVAGNELV